MIRVTSRPNVRGESGTGLPPRQGTVRRWS